MLNGCKCKTGSHSRVYGCKNNNCGPGCRCIGCGNGPSINTDSNVVHYLDDDGDTDELHCLEVQDILNESSDEGYTDESDDDTDQSRSDSIYMKEMLKALWHTYLVMMMTIMKTHYKMTPNYSLQFFSITSSSYCSHYHRWI